jgi:hypothetical protein
VCMRLVGLMSLRQCGAPYGWVMVKVHPFGTIHGCKEEYFEIDFFGITIFMPIIIS